MITIVIEKSTAIGMGIFLTILVTAATLVNIRVTKLLNDASERARKVKAELIAERKLFEEMLEKVNPK